MNIPLSVARAQGPHGIKGGRPRLNLSADERIQRRRDQQAAYRRRKGIPPRPSRGPSSWHSEYLEIWGKLPGEPLTPQEFAEREPFWNAKCEAAQRADLEFHRAKGKPWFSQWWAPPPPDVSPARVPRDTSCPCGSGLKARKCCVMFSAPVVAPVLPGRNDPCHCGSGRKFKKCCGC